MIENLVLAAHVVAGILFVGPVAVTTSLFPRYAAAPRETPAVAALLHRITRRYALLALVVPVLGLALAGVQDRLGEVWITAAMVLTAAAGGLLALRIVPLQGDTLTRGAAPGDARSLSLLTGVFNLLWVAIVVLMIVRPGAES